jgi:predicted nucleic acid-binding protein
VTFWDTSGIVPLLIEQPESAAMRKVLEADPELVVWWGTPVECWSAVARLRREDVIGLDDEARVLARIGRLREAWIEVLPSEELRRTAGRLLRVHPLRAADALQLAAALVWAGTPAGHRLVTYDERLARAAKLEGFDVLPA